MRQIDYVSTTALTPINPYTEHGGGGFKKLVTVAAIVVIPIAAPMITSAIATSMSMTLSTTAMTLGSAAAGGLMGAAVGAYTGQGAGKGALLGALSGGLAGYMQGGTAPTSTTTTTTTPGVDSGATATDGLSTYGYDAVPAENVVGPDGITTVDTSIYNQSPSTFTDTSSSSGVADRLSNVNTRVDGMGADLPNAMTMQGSNATANVAGTTTTGVNTAGVNMTPVNSAFGPVPKPTYTQMLDAGYTPQQLRGMELVGSPSLLSQTGTEIVNRFSNPDTLADVSIQAGINLIGAELLGVGDLSDEEKENLRLQREQMERLKERDEKAYNFAMKTAKEFYRLGENFDPEQIARQAYGKATRTAGIAKRDALRKINPNKTGLRAAEERRFALGSTANAASAYDRGMITGLNQKANYLQKASATFPNQGGSYSQALTGLNQTYADLARKRSEAQKGVNQMFGGFLTRRGDGNDDYRAGVRDAFGSFITARS